MVTGTVLNTKFSKVKNKIPVVSDLVKKTDYDAKILKGKCIAASDYNKFTNDILDANMKQQKLVNKSNISNLIKKSDTNQMSNNDKF